MATQARKMFSKLLTDTDIKKRLAIPEDILPSLPGFNGSHAVNIHLMYGTRIWPIVCSIRKTGYKKPVFSGGWRNFVICNNFNVRDRITLYKVQDEDGSSHYRVEVEKAASKQSGALPPRALSLNHEVDETTVTCRRKVRNFRHEQEQLPKAPDAPIKQEGSIMELANIATDDFFDHVIAKPPVKLFGTNLRDEASSKAHFKNEQETGMKFFGMGEPPFLSHSMTKEEREIKFFGLAEDGAMAYGSSQLAASGEACYKSSTDETLSLDLVLRQPIPYAVVKLDLTLAPPIVDGAWRS